MTQLSGAGPADIQGFHLLTPDEGWLLVDGRLYWTHDRGQSWGDITSSDLGPLSIQAVDFLDAGNPLQRTGWAVLAGEDGAGSLAYSLAMTSDGGATWQVAPLSFIDPGDRPAQAVYLTFISPDTGWLVLKQATGGSFSLGKLFKTSDGGRSWERLAIPIGAPVVFASEEAGWTAGGAAGNELYTTRDGGQNWTAQTVPGPEDQRRLPQLPVFTDTQVGLLPVVVNSEGGSRVDFYSSADGGQTWQPKSSVSLTRSFGPGSRPPLSIFSAGDWILLDPGSRQVASSLGSVQAVSPAGPDAMPAQIVELDMTTPEVGWARTASGDCQPAPGGGAGSEPALFCTTQTGLLQTSDGGRSWTALTLPQAAVPAGQSLPGLQGLTQITNGQGFDSCDIPALGDIQAWMDHSPYRVWNLYMGGSALAPCGTLTASYINQLALQGWKFTPIWVGPQASCSVFVPRMSSDPATAYNQGVSEANAAVDRAANLLLTSPDRTGSIVYYDLEAYDTTNSQCRSAAKSFIAGWTAQVQARGNQAGVYGSGCTSALSDFASNPKVPDAVWPAAWLTPAQYRSDASVWGVRCLSDGLWSIHQRLRQYAGGHNETWGGVTFNIDSNVFDGLVVNISGGPQIQVTAPLDSTWLPADWVGIVVTPVNPGAAIDRVEFEWHPADWQNSNWVYLGADTNGSDGWSFAFDTSSLPDQVGGAIYAIAYDSAGKRSGAGVWNLKVDHTPPVSSVITGAMYQDSPFRDFHVRWSGSDNLTGLVSYDVQYQDGAGGLWQDLVMDTTTTYYHFVGQVGHTYYFRIRARDGFGNLAAYTTTDVHFTVQNCPLAPDAYEIDDIPAAAKLIPADGSVQDHNFHVEGEEDWVMFTAQSGIPYTLATANTGGHADTVLYLYGPDGKTLLNFNDDYLGMNLASRIDFVSPSGGTYYLKVVHYDIYAAGCTTEYGLSVLPTNNYKAYAPLIRQ